MRAGLRRARWQARTAFRRAYVSEGAREETFARELATQQGDARGFVELQVVGFDARYLEQIGDDARVYIGVLAQVQRRKMEAESLDGANQAAERAACRQQSCTTFAQRMSDIDQIGAQCLGVRIRVAGRPTRRARAGGR